MQENDSPVLIFDGVCNLCNGLVTFILRNEKNTAIKFTALQYESSIALLARYGINISKDFDGKEAEEIDGGEGKEAEGTGVGEGR